VTPLGPDDELYRLAEELFAALNARDMERVVALSDEDLEFRSLIAASEGRVYRGLSGLRAWQREIDSTLDGYHAEVEEVHAGGDRVVVVMSMRGRGKSSGVPIDQRLGQLWHLRDGRPWRNDVYRDPAEALRAAGLEP
jgi:ketosteroid isomerase-like protein